MIDKSISLADEIDEQYFDGVAYGACTTNTFTLSNFLGNTGTVCTLTYEAQTMCH